MGTESLSHPLLEWEGHYKGLWEKEGWVCHLECFEEEPSGDACRNSPWVSGQWPQPPELFQAGSAGRQYRLREREPGGRGLTWVWQGPQRWSSRHLLLPVHPGSPD